MCRVNYYLGADLPVAGDFKSSLVFPQPAHQVFLAGRRCLEEQHHRAESIPENMGFRIDLELIQNRFSIVKNRFFSRFLCQKRWFWIDSESLGIRIDSALRRRRSVLRKKFAFRRLDPQNAELGTEDEQQKRDFWREWDSLWFRVPIQ